MLPGRAFPATRVQATESQGLDRMVRDVARLVIVFLMNVAVENGDILVGHQCSNRHVAVPGGPVPLWR
jgi:hypothetical protein